MTLSDDASVATHGANACKGAGRTRVGLERYLGLFDSLLEGVAYCRMVLDETGAPVDFVYLDVNPAFARLTGLSDVAGRLVTDLIPGIRESNPEIFDVYGHVARTGEPAQFDLDLKQLDVCQRVVATRPSPGHFLAVFQDVTEQRNSEAALRRSEEVYRELYERSPIGYQSLDEEGRVLTVNQAWVDTLGYERREVVGKWFGDFLAPEYVEVFREGFRRFKTSGRAHNESEMVRKDGERRFVAFDARIGLDEHGAFKQSHCVIQDISDRRRAEAAAKQSYESLEQMTFQVIEAMGLIVEARDPYTEGHEQRVSRIGKLIAAEMGLSAFEIATVGVSALLHDIGKLCVPAEILTRPGALSPSEFRLVKEHSRRGYEILKGISFPWPVADAVLQHHERMDGSGYPEGLAGDEISVVARVLGAADVVEAMSSHRPYRPALGVGAAIAELLRDDGAYDPAVVAASVALFESGRLGF